MIRPEFRKTLGRQHKILVFLWSAFVISIVLFLWFANFFLKRSSTSGEYGFSETLRIVLWLLSLLEIWLLVWWKGRYLSKEAILGGALKPAIGPSLRGYQSSLEQRAAEAASSYFIAKLTAFGMAEATALWGFVLAFVGGYVRDQYLLSLLSGVLLLFQFPSKGFLEELIREVEARGD